MKNPIRQYEVNTKGRDFVIGDLHGCFDIFLSLLDHLKFDGEVDRMFSVGDLIDRGPDSRLCLELLREPWFHACLANHEQMMLEAFKGGYMGMFWFRNGGLWGLEACNNFHQSRKSDEPEELTDDTKGLLELLEIVEELPFVMNIQMLDGRIAHVLHAEPPPNWVLTDETFNDPEKVLSMAAVQSSDGDFLVWGRHKFYQFYMSELSNAKRNARVVANMEKGAPKNDGLGPLISGHTKVQRPLTIMGQTNLDTAAHESYKNSHGSRERKWAGLTCLELNTWKFVRATDDAVYDVESVVVNTEILKNDDGEQHAG